VSRDRIRVALFVGSLGGGGAQRHVSLLAPRLDRERFEVLVLCRARAGEYLPELEAAGIEVVEMASNGRLFGPSALAASVRLARLIEERRLDVLHSFLFECNVQGSLARMLVPGVRHVAGLRNMDWDFGRVRNALYASLLTRADGVVAVCDAVRRRYAELGVPEERIAVVRNGVPAPEPAASHAAGDPAGGPVVLTLARLNRGKGLDTLLAAARLVLREIPRARFVIGGEGPDRGRLEKLRASMGLDGHVSMPGPLADPRGALRGAALFVLSSTQEGISNALLEAQSEGVASVATDVGGNAEVVEDGVTGLIVPSGRPDVLAGAICALLRDDARRASMAGAASRRARRVFGLETMVQALERYYERLCA